MTNGTPAADGLVTADIAWSSSNPHLCGNFAPIGPERDVAGLQVIAGRIPVELRGAYMRNGPNPLYEPISYAYPMDGDGMIHAVQLDGGRARYRNRFVRTRGLAVERRAGRAVYGGLMRPVPVDPAIAGVQGERGPIKNGAFNNVIRHGDALLAVGEAAPAYELTADLQTIGEWRAGTGRAVRLGAHNRRHPRTGALWSLVHSVTGPAAQLHEIDAAGRWRRSVPIALPAPSMIHDFALTERHVVLVVGPAVFDAAGARRGRPLLQWRPALPTRIAVVPLDGGDLVWLETDACFVSHFANGFERGGEIVVDYVRHPSIRLGCADRPAIPPRLHRAVLDPVRRRVRDEQLAPVEVELPRIDPRREALPTRFVYAAALTGEAGATRPPSGSFNAIVRIDAATGAIACHDFGHALVGEPAFVPRGRTGDEDDGYLALFAHDPVNGTSDLILLDAARVEAAPVAVIRLPQRVPQGLHGNWIPRR